MLELTAEEIDYLLNWLEVVGNNGQIEDEMYDTLVDKLEAEAARLDK